MFELKRWIETNGIKRVGLARFYRSASEKIGRAKNAGSLDIFYTKKFLSDECGIEADVIRVTDKVDFSKYDLLIFQPYTFIMFGGIWEAHAVDFIYDYCRHFDGTVMCIYNDPNVTWSNPLRVLDARNRVLRGSEIVSDEFDRSLIDAFESKKFVGMFIGRDFERFKKLAKTTNSTFWPEDIIKVKLSEYIHHNQLLDSRVLEVDPSSKKYDVVYYGSNRGGGRNKQMKRIFGKNESLKLRWIGYDPKFPNADWTKKVKYDDLGPLIDESLTSFVAGDPAHDDNIVIYRFYEALKFNVVNLISRQFDPEMKLLNHPTLQDVCYVESLEDVEKACKKLRESQVFYNTILRLQRDEILRVAASWRNDG